MGGLSEATIADRAKRLPTLSLDEHQAVVEYGRALRAKRAAVRALALSSCSRESDAAYQALDAADLAIRRGLRALNETLTGVDV